MYKNLEMSFRTTFSQHGVLRHNGRRRHHHMRSTTPIWTSTSTQQHYDTYRKQWYARFCNNQEPLIEVIGLRYTIRGLYDTMAIYSPHCPRWSTTSPLSRYRTDGIPGNKPAAVGPKLVALIGMDKNMCTRAPTGFCCWCWLLLAAVMTSRSDDLVRISCTIHWAKLRAKEVYYGCRLACNLT
jgi:hypothetical protein